MRLVKKNHRETVGNTHNRPINSASGVKCFRFFQSTPPSFAGSAADKKLGIVGITAVLH
jgi:hypothetical protein